MEAEPAEEAIRAVGTTAAEEMDIVEATVAKAMATVEVMATEAMEAAEATVVMTIETVEEMATEVAPSATPGRMTMITVRFMEVIYGTLAGLMYTTVT